MIDNDGDILYEETTKNIYRAMLDAAPQAPANQTRDEVIEECARTADWFKRQHYRMGLRIGQAIRALKSKPSTTSECHNDSGKCGVGGYCDDCHQPLAKPDPRDEALRIAREALIELQNLMEETTGVYGLHLNGDNSPWSEIEKGGRFERLTSFPDAISAIDAALKGVE